LVESEEAQPEDLDEKAKLALLSNTFSPALDVVSDTDGLFVGKMVLSVDEIQYKQGKLLRILAFTPQNAFDTFEFTSVPLIHPTGFSIISDVDDTIKKSNVFAGMVPALKKALLDQIEQVPGMSETYNKLHSKGWALHYVSAGPYQLFSFLDTFLSTFSFPIGSLNLRNTGLLSC
jgi:phosphatidate phosphatase APP1